MMNESFSTCSCPAVSCLGLVGRSFDRPFRGALVARSVPGVFDLILGLAGYV